MEIKSYRVILKKEEPSTDLKNEFGTLKCQESKILFAPQKSDKNLTRSYPMKDLQYSSIATIGSWFNKSKAVHLRFGSKDVFVNVFLEPMDHSPEFLLTQILECVENFKKGTLPGIVGSLIDKIGGESQKIIKEVGAIIQSSSRELTTALSQTTEFIQKAIQTANILESFETDEQTQSKTMNLDLGDIDEIMKRALASEKIDAMISSLIAKGLVSANDKNFQEALEALKIARDAAKNENLEEYEKLAEENIRKVKEAETSNYMDTFDPQFSEKATKYAHDARNIVAEWEESKPDESNNV
ncbi:MAG: hypothetical protein ACW98F_13760 [Candidatus Hodarchaeales archaeon]|jgi:rRNA-processing protein FCF1